MSSQQRKGIAYWFLLLAGIALTTMQLIKYGLNTLEFTYGEVVVCVVAVSFMILPRFILNMFEKFLTTKKPE